MDIFDRIQHERVQFLWKYGKAPSAIYLGNTEYMDARSSADAMLMFGMAERDEILGIPFFRVTAESHLGLGV